MLKADAQISTGKASATKRKIVNAALETLKTEGFKGASARTIAERGDFNQALIFYHFGSVHSLLLAALDATSAARMEAYEAAVEDAETVEEMLWVAAEVYREDLDSGHITVLSEMIAGTHSHPELGPEIAARMEPWITFAEKAVKKSIRGTPLADLLPTRDIAYGIVALYLGIELMTVLYGDKDRVERLFHMAAGFATAAQTALGAE